MKLKKIKIGWIILFLTFSIFYHCMILVYNISCCVTTSKIYLIKINFKNDCEVLTQLKSWDILNAFAGIRMFRFRGIPLATYGMREN